MVFKCAKGMFELKKNYREAFNLEAFVGKYLEEYFDKDMYIVGDISSEILRLKGFNTDPKSENYFGFIEDYLEISCAFGCPYYILRRIRNEEEYKKLEQEDKPVDTEDDRITIHPMVKENFDKESLILKPSQKGKPNIVIDSRKINAIPKGELPLDLKDDTDSTPKKITSKEEEKPVVTQTFVSASEGFDPSKMKDRRKNQDKRKNPKDNGNNKPRLEQKDNRPKDNKLKLKGDNALSDNNQNKDNHQDFNKNKNHFKKNKNFNGPKPDKRKGQ